MSFLGSWFDQRVETMKIGGNQPFYLDQPEQVSVVESGHIDLFFTRHKEGEITGQKRHVFRAQPGTALFGISFQDCSEDARLQAVAGPGTSIYRMDTSTFWELTELPDHEGHPEQLIDDWLEGLMAGAETIPPRDSEEIRSGTYSPQESTVYRPRDRTLWVRHQEGKSDFLGEEQFSLGEQPGYFPLPDQSWMVSEPGAKFDLITSEQWITSEENREGLQNFSGWLCLYLFHRDQEERREWQQRLSRRKKNEVEHQQRSLRKLADVLDQKADEESVSSGRDPLIEACEWVGAELGIEIDEPEHLYGENQILDPLEKISHTSGFRTREVSLKGDWWSLENGPLLGFLSENDQPVALLPDDSGGYRLKNPATGDAVSVDADRAKMLRSEAYQFYPSLPDRPLEGSDIFSFLNHKIGREALIVATVGLAGGLLSLLTPILTQSIFDTVIPSSQTEQLLYISLGLIAAAVGSALFNITRGFAMLRFEQKTQSRLQAAVWDRLLDLPVPFFKEYTVGDLAMRAQGITQIRQQLSGHVLTTILSSIFSVFNFFLLFYYSAQLAFVATGLVAIAFFITLVVGYLQVRYQRQLHELEGELSGTVLQFLEGIAKLRIAGAEFRAFSRWTERYSKQRKLDFQAGEISNYEEVFDGIYPLLSSIAIFGFVGFAINTGTQEGFSTGAFLAFSSAYGQFLSAGLQMAGVLLSVLQIVPLWERAQPILQAQPEIDEGSEDPGPLTGEIEMKGISFRYGPDQPDIFDDLSFEISSGEFVAFVGPSGAGKSTLVRLLLGFEHPRSGSVYYDGKDLANLDCRAVRRQIGVVLQNARVQSGDMKKNILGASSQLDLDDAWEAARLSGLDQDIEEMPMGMHTVVMEGGGTLSGGQRQRLLIARSLVRKPRILFFDEATSALDNQTQNIVKESTDQLDATRVVIAHRLSTIKNADRILMIDEGRIIEEGPYKELMELDGRFAQLARRQLA